MMKKINIKKSKIDNKGIFALEKICRWETICFLLGVEKNLHQIEKDVLAGKERINDPLQIGEEIYLDIEEPYIYFNHSCNPNSGIRGKNELFAIKDIGIGEEITFDYSTTSWEKEWNFLCDEEFAMKCSCNSKNCRKIIRDFPFLLERIKKKYLRLRALPDFILKK